MSKNERAEIRARELVAKLTLEEAVSQLSCDSPAIPRLGIPQYCWWNEALHGVARAGIATVFPQAIALAAMFDPDMIERVGRIISTEGRAMYREFSGHGMRGIYRGLTYWSPNINIFRDPRWGRGHETYGEDPYLTAECGKAFVRGVQQKKDGVMCAAACAKHYAVHSGPEGKRHGFDARVSPKQMTETYLYAFEELVRDGVEGVMGAYNRVNGQPCCSSDLLQGKLREWGFDGYFTSDCGALGDIHAKDGHAYTENEYQTAIAAVLHGCDTECGSGSYRSGLVKAVENGEITEEAVREACVHLFRTRFRLGLFDEETPFDTVSYTCVGSREHVSVAEACAERALVLLKNDGILPLDSAKYRNIAVIGPTAASCNVLLGNYNGKPNRAVSILEGIQERFPGHVLTASGCPLYDPNGDDAGTRDAEICAENADLIIACVGLEPCLEGEECEGNDYTDIGDKRDIRLPDTQRELLRRLEAAGKPMVVVCTSGSSVNTEITGNALLQVFYPGQTGGAAVARVLFGDVSPSGKLPVTFYESADRLPDFADYSMRGRTYRYTDENVLYPFGFGLTYTTCEVTDLSFDGANAAVRIRNTGSRASRDVVQFYVASDSPDADAKWSLCGICPVSLVRGEERVIRVRIAEKAFTDVAADGTRQRTASVYTLYAGTHAPDARSEKLSGSACCSLRIAAADIARG